MMKKAMAYWGAFCPGCNIGRKYPDSFIGKRVVKHWKKGCSVNQAYKEVFGKTEENNKKDKG